MDANPTPAIYQVRTKVNPPRDVPPPRTEWRWRQRSTLAIGAKSLVLTSVNRHHNLKATRTDVWERSWSPNSCVGSDLNDFCKIFGARDQHVMSTIPPWPHVFSSFCSGNTFPEVELFVAGANRVKQNRTNSAKSNLNWCGTTTGGHCQVSKPIDCRGKETRGYWRPSVLMLCGNWFWTTRVKLSYWRSCRDNRSFCWHSQDRSLPFYFRWSPRPGAGLFANQPHLILSSFLPKTSPGCPCYLSYFCGVFSHLLLVEGSNVIGTDASGKRHTGIWFGLYHLSKEHSLPKISAWEVGCACTWVHGQMFWFSSLSLSWMTVFLIAQTTDLISTESVVSHPNYPHWLHWLRR